MYSNISMLKIIHEFLIYYTFILYFKNIPNCTPAYNFLIEIGIYQKHQKYIMEYYS